MHNAQYLAEEGQIKAVDRACDADGNDGCGAALAPHLPVALEVLALGQDRRAGKRRVQLDLRARAPVTARPGQVAWSGAWIGCRLRAHALVRRVAHVVRHTHVSRV